MTKFVEYTNKKQKNDVKKSYIFSFYVKYLLTQINRF